MRSRTGSSKQSRSSSGQPNLTAAARGFLLQAQRLRARWNGRPSKIQTISGNRRLSEHQELEICQYLDHLDNTGLSARRFMIAECANAISRRSHLADLDGPPPQVSQRWAHHFPERHLHPEYIVDKAEQAQTKARRRGLLTAVAATQRDMVKMRKKIKEELCKEIRVKAKAREK